jgi:hypothetical protein
MRKYDPEQVGYWMEVVKRGKTGQKKLVKDEAHELCVRIIQVPLCSIHEVGFYEPSFIRML